MMNQSFHSRSKIVSLTVVLPVYNEEKIIERSLRSLAATLQEGGIDYEILVVDDGSTDKTRGILSDLSGDITGLKILRHSKNQGLGGALQYGFSEASKPLIFYTDADMPFKYSEILQALLVLESSGSDIIAGFRKNREREGFFRRICSRSYNLCVRSMYGVQLHDINCAFKLIRSDALRKIDLKAKGSFIDAEFVIKASYAGFRIREFALEYFPRDDNDSRLFRIFPVTNAFIEMVKLYPDIVRVKHSKKKD